MIRKTAAAVSLLLLAEPLLPASITLSPVRQSVETSCRLYLSADGLSGAAGLDIVVVWEPAHLSCVDVSFDRDRLPGFIDVFTTIDNESGRLEMVLLDLFGGASTTGADSLLVVEFVPAEAGTTPVRAIGWGGGADPVLIDSANNAVAVAGDDATIVAEGTTPAATATRLHQNFPNPFNPGTTIRFDVPRPSPVFLRIYDPAGRLVRSLIEGERYGIGSWERLWDGRNDAGYLVPSGIYFCVLEAAGGTEGRKLVVLR